jgi:hypothetical protein
MTILDTLTDRKLFASLFPDPETWSAWLAFLAAVFGLPMTEAQMELYRRCTGRQTPPTAAAREVWCIAGRRAGKSRIAALLGIFLAAFRDYKLYLAPGEKATVALIAADRQQARVCFRYVTGLLDAVPMLRRLVLKRTQSTVELRGNVVIEVHTCSYRTTRGYSFAAIVADETAFWRDESSASPDVEVLTALRPGLATIPGSMLIAISSPYSRRGALWQAFKDHYGQDGDPVVVWQSDTATMNPSVDPAVIASAYEADPAAAASEYGGAFRSDLEAFVSREALEACIIPNRRELPPAGHTYVAFADPSGGTSDSFTLAVCHGEVRGEQTIAVVDCIREMKPPFSPESVVRELASVLKSYRVAKVSGDRYAGVWPAEAFAKQEIVYEPSAAPKSDLYRDCLPLLNSQRIELPDLPRLHTQFLSLERRTARGGKDSIDHPPGGHDDLANAVAGVALEAARGVSGGEIRATNLGVPRSRTKIDWSEIDPAMPTGGRWSIR